jgi:2'-5' RNA ligase
MPQTLPTKIRIIFKDANPHAKAGETIAGNLVRGTDGKFSSGASGAPKPKKGKGGKGGGVAKKPKLTPEQEAKNLGDLANGQLGSDLAEALTVGNPPGDLSGVKPEFGDQLVKKGLAVKHADGSYELSPGGKTYVKAASSGDAGKAKAALASAKGKASDVQAKTDAANSKRSATEQARTDRQNAAQAKRDAAEQARSQKPAAGSGKAPTGPKATALAKVKAPAVPKPKAPAKGGGSAKAPAKPKAPAAPKKPPALTPEQRQQNAGKIQDKQLGDDSEAFGFINDPTSGTAPEDLKPEYQKHLIDKGLLRKNTDGTLSLTPEAHAYQKASETGDEQKAAGILAIAAAKQNARNATAASKKPPTTKPGKKPPALKPAKTKKKEFAGSLRIHFKAGPSMAERSDMPRSKFVFWEDGKGVFPVESRSAVMRAVHAWGRYKGPHSFEDFKRNLTRIANSNDWSSALPADWTDKKTTKASNPKVAQTMGEFKRGGLHSGSAKGPKVRDRKQAIAIALSQAGLSKKTKEGEIVEQPQPQQHTGAMLAFMLPIEAANQLAQVVPGCEPDGMHLTLCYLGDTTELPYRMEDVVMAIAEHVTGQPPIFGSISGTGRFSNVDEGDGVSAFYASFDAPNLPEFRQGLVECLGRSGLSYTSNHGYTPHITLSYLENGTPAPDVQLPPLKLRFDSLTLAWGDQHIQIPLGEMPDPFDYYASKDVAGGMAGYGHGPGGAFTPGSLGGSGSGGSGHSSAVMNAAQMPKTGDMVSWQTSGGKGRGKIVSLHKASTVRKTPVKTVGTEDEPAARIEIYSPNEMGEWQPTGTHIAHAVSSLTKLIHQGSTKEAGKLSVYKDANGLWRWLTFSSSGYLDRDGEIVPTDELTQDCARADNDGDYGPLLWWHEKSLELGKCDFNAMCGRILVESGTFNDPEVGQAFSELEEELGTSIGFGYEAKAQGVYKGIRKFERSLLPDVVASNTLTRVFINGDTNNMATIQKDKKGILERILGKDKVAQIESHATAAEKQAQLAGLAYKATKPPGPTFPPKPTAKKPAVDPTTDPNADTETKADPMAEDEEDMLDGGADEGAEDEEGMDEEAPEEEGEEGEEFEGSPGDNVLDTTMQALHDSLDEMIEQTINTALSPIKEMLHAQGDTATKEVNSLAVAYKETTGILITALKENTEALKMVMGANQDAAKRLVQLERKVAAMTGELPRAVKAQVTRASASPATIVGQEAVKENLDPDTQAMNRLAERLASGAIS